MSSIPSGSFFNRFPFSAFDQKITSWWIYWAFALLTLSIPRQVFSEVPREAIVVLANKNSSESISLAKYYLRARDVGENQLLLLDLPLEETVDRETYEKKIIFPIRAALIARQISSSTRVLLSLYGIPLRVFAPEAKGDELEALLDARNYKKQARDQLREIAATASSLSGDSLKGEAFLTLADDELISRIRTFLEKAAQRKEGDEKEQKTQRIKLTKTLAAFGGIAGLAQSISVPTGVNNEKARAALEKLQHDVQATAKLLGALDETRTKDNRKRSYDLTSRVFGAIGVLSRANIQEHLYSYKDADASVDSELSFLWYNREHYLTAERIPNPYYHEQLVNGKPTLPPLPIMLVSRIDGSTSAKAQQLIDSAIRAEKEGLRGEVFIDARGLPAADESYGVYDENLRDLASLLRRKTDFSVHLDNNDARFEDAKNTAIYCGWYRLRHYEDVFSFSPGAIGYHIASEEAVSLHDSNETGWCKNAIDRGISVTIGAVGEPYLDSFPRPVEFFGLLFTGRYQLIEAYALINPFISWRMVLLGDPLYRPFRKPFLDGETLAQKDEHAKTLNPLPSSPLEQGIESPEKVLEKLKIRQEALVKEIDKFYSELMKRLAEKSQTEEK